MNDFANILYERFFIRDLLGKIAPGAIAILAAVQLLQVGWFELLKIPSGLEWFFSIVLFATALAIGIAVQVFGESVGLHSSHPHPLPIFFASQTAREARQMFRERQTLCQQKEYEDFKNQRERFAYLKEACGNQSIALFLLAVSLYDYPFAAISILSASLILHRAHVVHRSRQAHFEISSLGLTPGSPNPGAYSQEQIDKYIGKEI